MCETGTVSSPARTRLSKTCKLLLLRLLRLTRCASPFSTLGVAHFLWQAVDALKADKEALEREVADRKLDIHRLTFAHRKELGEAERISDEYKVCVLRVEVVRPDSHDA